MVQRSGIKFGLGHIKDEMPIAIQGDVKWPDVKWPVSDVSLKFKKGLG